MKKIIQFRLEMGDEVRITTEPATPTGEKECNCHCHHQKEGKTCMIPSPQTKDMPNACHITSCEHCTTKECNNHCKVAPGHEEHSECCYCVANKEIDEDSPTPQGSVRERLKEALLGCCSGDFCGQGRESVFDHDEKLLSFIEEEVERAREDALRGKIQGFKTIEINETYKVPAELQDHFRNEGRTATIKEAIEKVNGMTRKRYRDNRSFMSHRDDYNDAYNDALNDLLKALASLEE